MATSDSSFPSARIAWTTVAILMMTYVFSFIDRQILGFLVKPIEHDLAIGDTEMSYLLGLSFALFYTFCGLPIGRLADSRSRRGLIAAGLALWSGMTAACGLARGYTQFLLFRMGVGVGEATLSPSAYSLIADSFEPVRRPTAISVYTMGIYIGSGIAFIVGGLLAHYAATRTDVMLPLLGAVRPWQLIFLILGVAGLIFTLALLAVHEPARQGVGAMAGLPTLRQVAAHLSANRGAVLCHNLGFAMMSLVAYGAAAWVPTFFMRTYGWDTRLVGIVYGSITAIFGCAGVVTGGRLAEVLARRGRSDATLRVGRLGALLALPFGVLYPLAATPAWAAIFMAPAIFCLAMPYGVAAAAIQEIMPNRMRASASALYLFAVNLIGLGLGPTAVALITDRVFHDPNAVRYSLLILSVVAEVLAITLLSIGLRHYRESRARLDGREA